MRDATPIHVGTSGWHYPDWRGTFYPEDLPAGAWLPRYAQAFDAVEVDATFYRLPSEAAFRRWAEQVPAGFRFAVTAPRTITHFRRLRGAEAAVERFLGRARLLGPHLGPILWQLRPDMPVDLKLLRDFLTALPTDLTHAVEARHKSWFTEPVYDLLRDRGAPLVIWNAGELDSPAVLTGPVVYLRYHGAGPAIGYPPARVEADAARIAAWAERGHEVWAFFDNDLDGHAVRDAMLLRRALERYTRPLEPA
jgi:uncharacterized protein YecE (DUF72 family)